MLGRPLLYSRLRQSPPEAETLLIVCYSSIQRMLSCRVRQSYPKGGAGHGAAPTTGACEGGEPWALPPVHQVLLTNSILSLSVTCHLQENGERNKTLKIITLLTWKRYLLFVHIISSLFCHNYYFPFGDPKSTSAISRGTSFSALHLPLI